MPESCRWDSARTEDGGRSWATDWIMEFSRTRPATELDQDVLFEEDWNVRPVSKHAAARALDWTVGTWSGTWTDVETGASGEARYRSRVLNGDTLIVDLLETRVAGEQDWEEAPDRARLRRREWQLGGLARQRGRHGSAPHDGPDRG